MYFNTPNVNFFGPDIVANCSVHELGPCKSNQKEVLFRKLKLTVNVKVRDSNMQHYNQHAINNSTLKILF
jgi:hypothetical protein